MIRSKKFLSFLVGTALLAGGCSKDRFDDNSNPNSVTDVSVTADVLLPGALHQTSMIVATDYTFLNMWMGYWARNGSYQSLTDIETYKFGNNFQAQIWFNLYSNNNTYNIMVNKAKATGADFYQAIGRLMMAHNFGLLVDTYNNIPYSEAFKGTALITPKYDKGADVYKDLFKQIDTATSLLKRGKLTTDVNSNIATADLVYAGDATKWIKFANALRLRLLMHLHNGINTTQVVPGFEIERIKDSIKAGPIMGRGDGANLNPGFSATKPTPYYRAYVQNEAGTQTGDVIRAGEFAVEYLKYNGDPRIGRFYTAIGSDYKGNRFGRPSDGSGNFTGDKLSTIRGVGLLPNGASSRAWVFTAFESLFLQAEARQRGILTTGTAATLLRDAIRESFTFLGLTDAQADAYIASNATYPDVDINAAAGVVPGAPAGGLYTILVQKWFAQNSIAAYETWSDYRRTDYVLGSPVGLAFTGPPISVDPGNTSTKIPVRLLYPQNEYNYNAANVGAEGTLNVFNNRVFWDLN